MNAATDVAPPPGRGGFKPSRLVPLVVLALGLAAFFALGWDRYLSIEQLKEHRIDLQAWVAGHPAVAGLAFAGGYAVAVAFSIPGAAILTICGGFLFGPLPATLYVVLGATAGATALFLAARFALRDFLRARVGGALARMEAGFNENPLSYMLILRLVPAFPFWLVNLVPAFLGVRLSTYVIGTFFGIIPGTVVYALIGDGAGAVLEAGGDIDLGIVFAPRFLAPIIGLAALAAIPIVYRRVKRRRAGPR